MSLTVKIIRTPVLDIAYEEHGSADGPAAILLHGFPYSPRGYDDVAPPLAAKGFRVLVPYLRGYGPTRFLSETLRSGQQAALAQDLLDFMDALGIERAALVGYDWGGRAACIIAALWPERVTALVTGDGYNLQNIPASVVPASAETEHRFWYQYYFHSPRGERGLRENRDGICRLLWKLWSPTWAFTEADYSHSVVTFDNPDFVDVVIHSYRHRFGYVPGDPAYQAMEDRLAKQPTISVPTIALFGADDGVAAVPRPDAGAIVAHFTGRFEARTLPGVGHNIPQEAPGETVKALLDLLEPS